ncbi:MAG: nucleotide sugar dehydrogenase [bacterium]
MKGDDALWKKTPRNILCIGAGYVGGPTMAVLADRCPDIKVTVVDSNEAKIRSWNSAALPIYEPGLDEIVARTRGRNLFFSPDVAGSIQDADMIFVCVNTPTKEFGSGSGYAADMQYMEQTARTILRHSKNHTIVVEKSTVPVRTAKAIARILYSNADHGVQFEVLSNPEFMAEGSAVRDLEEPDRVLIGSRENETGKAARRVLADLYARWIPRERILETNVWSSELSKLMANAFLAQRISSINSISALCEKTGADVEEVSRAIGMDSRVGSKFLRAGVGFGGSCFRKDILNLVYLCRGYGLHEVADYWESVVRINDYQKRRFVETIIDSMFHTVTGKKITILGFAFKPDTGDTRDAPAIYVCKKLLEEKARLSIVDPQALENARKDLRGIDAEVQYEDDVYKAVAGSHALVLATEWRQFRDLDYERIYALMEKPAFIFDGRNLLAAEMLAKIGFHVFPVGKVKLSSF